MKANRQGLLKLVCSKCGWVRWVRRRTWFRGHAKRCRTCKVHSMQVGEWGWVRDANVIGTTACPFCATGYRTLTDTGLVSPCGNCGDDEMTKLELEEYVC
jgi:hypothetical protein